MFPFPAHQTGRVHFEHPAFRLVSPQHPRERSPPHGAERRHRGFLTSHCDTAGSKGHSSTRCYRLIVNHRSVSSFTSTPEARVLPSTGITRPPRYLDPLRLPDRPPSLEMMLEVRPPPAPGLPNLRRPLFPHAVLSTPVDRTGACRFLPHSCGLPRLTGGSASTTSLSRPAQASLALRPAESLARLKRTLSRGFDLASCPTKPLGSYHAYQQLHGWNPPPQVICA